MDFLYESSTKTRSNYHNDIRVHAYYLKPRFVCEVLFEDPIDPTRSKPEFQSIQTYRIGRMNFKKVGSLPDRLVEVSPPGADRSIGLGSGNIIRVADDQSNQE
ncbi:hypothetical protein AB6803_20100 [Rhizobium sp. RCC_161_2]